MADAKKDQQGSIWPLPKFYFSLQLGDGIEAKFQEVNGLQTEVEPSEFRHLDHPKISGVFKSTDVTLRRGVVARDSDLWNWLKEVNANTPKRRTVTVSLNEATGKRPRVWRLKNAWPKKIAVNDFKAEGNEVAIETLELAHEGIDLELA